jgi:hypothetical protein
MPVFISSDKVDGLLRLDRFSCRFLSEKGESDFNKAYSAVYNAAQTALVSLTTEFPGHGHYIDAFVSPALLLRDEAKRYCLPFLKENGASSEFSSFTCKARPVYIVSIGWSSWHSPEDFSWDKREKVEAAGKAAYRYFMESREVQELPEDLHLYVRTGLIR